MDTETTTTEIVYTNGSQAEAWRKVVAHIKANPQDWYSIETALENAVAMVKFYEALPADEPIARFEKIF